MDAKGPEELAARVAELEATVALLRKRLHHLVRLLPADVLSAVPEAFADEVAAPPAWSPTAGWVETVELVPSDVPRELEALWRRVARPPEP